MTNSLFNTEIHSSAEIILAKADILLLSTTMYNNSSRPVAHGLKDGKYSVIVKAAGRMAACVPENAVLVPVPSHRGYAEQTLVLANEIARICGAEVANVLRGKERKPNYDAKREGKPLSIDDLGIYMTGELPQGKLVVVIDNVIDSGVTAFAAANAIGTCAVLAYAMTSVLL